MLMLHCEHGVGRGPPMGLAVMVARGAHAPDAYREVRTARWQATLNDRQLDGLADFVTAWAARKPGRDVGARGGWQRLGGWRLPARPCASRSASWEGGVRRRSVALQDAPLVTDGVARARVHDLWLETAPLGLPGCEMNERHPLTPHQPGVIGLDSELDSSSDLGRRNWSLGAPMNTPAQGGHQDDETELLPPVAPSLKRMPLKACLLLPR